MTLKKMAIADLKKLQKIYSENAHEESIEILCELLKKLGLEEVVEEYNKVRIVPYHEI